MIDFRAYNYQNILASMLAQVSDKFDKRDTSPIQTALGPAAYALEEYYLNLANIQKGAYITTAEGEDLDELAIVGNVTRQEASPAVRLGVFDQEIPVGSRFSTVNGANSINFTCKGPYQRTLGVTLDQTLWTARGLPDGSYVFVCAEDKWLLNGEPAVLALYGLVTTGTFIRGDSITVVQSSGTATATAQEATGYFAYQLTAETPGTIGNDYSGAILPISVIPNLTYAYIADILVLGDDEETDDELRSRLIESLTVRPFGGNITAYRQAALAIDGVGGVQVYPTWDGGGTVKLSLLGTDYLPASAAVVENVQNEIDPTPQGSGFGMAPIGAVVSVTAATALDIDITATVELAPGHTLAQLLPMIKAAIADYLLSTRKSWDAQLAPGEYSSIVYRSRVITAILSVQGVVNVSALTLNGTNADIVLTETGALQEVAVEGQVVISE